MAGCCCGAPPGPAPRCAEAVTAAKSTATNGSAQLKLRATREGPTREGPRREGPTGEVVRFAILIPLWQCKGDHVRECRECDELLAVDGIRGGRRGDQRARVE